MEVILICFLIGKVLIMELLKKLYQKRDKDQKDLFGVCQDKLTLQREVISKLNIWNHWEHMGIILEIS